MIDLTDSRQREKEAKLEVIGRIIRTPSGPAKWQAIHSFWLTLSPKNPLIARDTAAWAKDVSKTRRNQYGTSGDKNSNLRMGIKLPTAFYYTLKAFETHLMNDPNDKGGRKELAQLVKAFPQYAVVEKF